MDNAYKSLDIFKDIEIKGKSYRIRKLNLGQFIEFSINYRILQVQRILRLGFPRSFEPKVYANALNACYSISTDTKAKQDSIKEAVVDESEIFSRPTVGEKTKASVHDDNYFQNIIHTFAWNYGWSKDEILRLYPDEISLYIKRITDEISLKNKKDALFMCDLNFIVSKTMTDEKGFKKLVAYTENRQKEILAEGNPNKDIDLKAFRASQDEWLKKSGVPVREKKVNRGN